VKSVVNNTQNYNSRQSK